MSDDRRARAMIFVDNRKIIACPSSTLRGRCVVFTVIVVTRLHGTLVNIYLYVHTVVEANGMCAEENIIRYRCQCSSSIILLLLFARVNTSVPLRPLRSSDVYGTVHISNGREYHSIFTLNIFQNLFLRVFDVFFSTARIFIFGTQLLVCFVYMVVRQKRAIGPATIHVEESLTTRKARVL